MSICFGVLLVSTEHFNGIAIHDQAKYVLAYAYAHQKRVVKMATLERLDNGAKKRYASENDIHFETDRILKIKNAPHAKMEHIRIKSMHPVKH